MPILRACCCLLNIVALGCFGSYKFDHSRLVQCGSSGTGIRAA